MKFQYICAGSVLLALSGCTPVQVDTQPKQSLGGSRFVVSMTSCSQIINSRSVLPLDIYHTGVCYEQGVAVPASATQAAEYYYEAARWSVPEARTALGRLGRPVPAADLQKQQERRGDQRRGDQRRGDQRRGDQIEDGHYGSRRIKVIHSQ